MQQRVWLSLFYNYLLGQTDGVICDKTLSFLLIYEIIAPACNWMIISQTIYDNNSEFLNFSLVIAGFLEFNVFKRLSWLWSTFCDFSLLDFHSSWVLSLVARGVFLPAGEKTSFQVSKTLSKFFFRELSRF